MKTNIEFKSNLFPRCEEEEMEINTGRCEKRSAEYIHNEIPKYGIEVEGIFSEDWGWIVPI